MPKVLPMFIFSVVIFLLAFFLIYAVITVLFGLPLFRAFIAFLVTFLILGYFWRPLSRLYLAVAKR